MKVFVTGATGYIGGSVAVALAKKGHIVHGLLRDADKAPGLEKYGIIPVVGTLNNFELLNAQASAADVIINAADSLNFEASRALSEGAQPYGTIIIHTSGIGLFSEDAGGIGLKVTNYDDADDVIPGNHSLQQHMRSVENIFLKDTRPGIHSAVVSNSLIYGKGLGMKKTSIQIPLMKNKAIENGFVAVVGDGLNRWSAVHINDVVDLYIRIIESKSATGFFFAENGNVSFRDIGQSLAMNLNLPLRELPLEEASKIYGEMVARYLLASQSVVTGSRARREVEWQPEEDGLIEWIAAGMQ